MSTRYIAVHFGIGDCPKPKNKSKLKMKLTAWRTLITKTKNQKHPSGTNRQRQAAHVRREHLSHCLTPAFEALTPVVLNDAVSLHPPSNRESIYLPFQLSNPLLAHRCFRFPAHNSTVLCSPLRSRFRTLRSHFAPRSVRIRVSEVSVIRSSCVVVVFVCVKSLDLC